MATQAGMHFYDENDLRRLGYDKTPDIKMLLPFLYKGEIINWIESKANFGCIKTHKTYIQQQLSSYCNRLVKFNNIIPLFFCLIYIFYIDLVPAL